MARPLQGMGGRKWYILEAFPPSYLPTSASCGREKELQLCFFLFFSFDLIFETKGTRETMLVVFQLNEGRRFPPTLTQHSASGWGASAARRWLVSATHARHTGSINGGGLSVKRRCDAGRAPVVRPLPRHILLGFASRLITHKDTLTTLSHPTLSESLTDNNRKLIKGAPDYRGQRVIISKIPMHTKQDTIGYLFKAELLYNLTCCVSSDLQYGTKWTFAKYRRLKCNWWRSNEIDLFNIKIFENKPKNA